MNDIKYTNGIVYNTYEEAIDALPKTNAGDSLRKSARVQREKAQESFDRCDTDGFLSQWASGINAQLDDELAELADHGNQTVVTVIIDSETDKVIGVRPVVTKYGESIPCVRNGETVWINPYLAKDSTYAKKGVRRAYMHCYATAKLKGTGYGLSGSCFVATIPFYNWLEVQVGLRQATQVA